MNRSQKLLEWHSGKARHARLYAPITYHPPVLLLDNTPSPMPPPSRLQELFSWGGIAIALMLALLVATAVWSVNRRRTRSAAVGPDKRSGQRDAWAEAGQRAQPLSADDLDDRYQ